MAPLPKQLRPVAKEKPHRSVANHCCLLYHTGVRGLNRTMTKQKGIRPENIRHTHQRVVQPYMYMYAHNIHTHVYIHT